MHDGVDHTLFIFNLHTKILSLYLYDIQSVILGITTGTKRWKKKPSYLEDRRLVHGGESPSTLVPCLKPTALTLTFQSPLTPSHPLSPYYITTTTSTISVLIRNSRGWSNQVQEDIFSIDIKHRVLMYFIETKEICWLPHVGQFLGSNLTVEGRYFCRFRLSV
jgi:hypothetical protein